ncbi:MAG: RepB family plasmid replication initiator protein, partial [Bacillota bacterium]|nr:RepB family plasmid replication initiator protein [Bacillota bacterium]
MFGNTIIKVNKSSYEKLQESFQKLPNKTFSLILYEEEIYVGSIEIPTVRKKWVSGMVQSSLIHTFEEIDKLSYSYEIVSKMKGMYSIRLFCINSERNELFHHMVGRSRISSVYLIQFCYIHYVFSMLRRRDYILI